MTNKFACCVHALFILACVSSKAVTEESDVYKNFKDFANGRSNETGLAVVVDVSSGNVQKAKEFWMNNKITHNGEVLFGVLDGTGYETLVELDDVQEVSERIKSLEPQLNMNPSSSDLFRFLLKTMSLTPLHSDIVLFTGRATEEEPLQKASLEKAREKYLRVFVIWTGDPTGNTGPLRSIAVSSNGSLENVFSATREVSTRQKTETQPEGTLIQQTLSKMVEQSENEFQRRTGEISIETSDKTLKKMERVRFPDKNSPEGISDGDIPNFMQNFSKPLEKQLSRVNHFIPVKVEVSSSSNLVCMPGTQQVIQYEVKNNLYLPLRLQFTAGQPQNIKIINVQPKWYTLQSLETIKVDVTFQTSAEVPEGGEGMLSFAAHADGGGVTPRQTLIYFSNKHVSDNWDPKVTYAYLADCRGHDKPDTCDSGEWKFEATFQDETSGLKKVLSEPYGLVFKAPFIAGTKAPVSVSYAASCCQPKIDIWAEDGQGNYVRRSLDVYNQGLLAGEIAAVVLGVLLLLCVIIGIIVTIIIVKRRKQDKLVIPRYQTSN